MSDPPRDDAPPPTDKTVTFRPPFGPAADAPPQGPPPVQPGPPLASPSPASSALPTSRPQPQPPYTATQAFSTSSGAAPPGFGQHQTIVVGGRSAMAVVGFVLSVLAVLLIAASYVTSSADNYIAPSGAGAAALAIILGVIGIAQTKPGAKTGRGMAITGVVLALLAIAGFLVAELT